MGFRERPEYQEWRDAVFRLFGRKCIRCGHAGNIHAHHVMPVADYPELAFDANNGVPLCGNCHVEIKGQESAHADDLKRLQRAILGGEAAGAAASTPNESERRDNAYAEPSNAEAVGQWFEHTTDSLAVVDFCKRYAQFLPIAPILRVRAAVHLARLKRWQEVIEASDAAISGAEQEGVADRFAANVADLKCQALEELGRLPESVAFLRELVSRFPESADLHRRLSVALREMIAQTKDRSLREECQQHTIKTAELAPGQFEDVFRASRALMDKASDIDIHGQFSGPGADPVMVARDLERQRVNASALQYAKRALALASTAEQKVLALMRIAEIHVENELCAEARSYLRQALQIDDCNVQVIGNIAGCYAKEGNCREAAQVAKRGLMLDPDNTVCRINSEARPGCAVWQF